jgi:hypothetical protein
MSSFQTILAGLRDVSERVLQELSTLTVTVSGAVSALDKAKADKVTLTAFTIPTTGWQQDGNYGYPYYVDLPVSGLTENDVVAVEITPAGQNVAETACFLSSSESLSGVLRLRAKHIPTAALAAYYYIIREDLLMAFGPLAVGTTPYTLPAATATTLGGVKVGTGLNITPDGTLSAAEQYALPAATATTLGGVKVGTGLNIAPDGTLSAAEQYALPAATADQLGGVKVGDYLDIAPDGTLSGKTLNDKIAAAVAVKSTPRLVWNQQTKSPNKWRTYDVSIPDGVDYVHIRTKCDTYTGTEFDLARGGNTSHVFDTTPASVVCTMTFRADGTLHIQGPYSSSNYSNAIELWLSGYHYPTLGELVAETQAAQADTDALAVDQEYRLTLLEAGVDPTIT